MKKIKRKYEMNDKNIAKIYKSEMSLRMMAKDQQPLDKLCTKIAGPVGSKEWLHNDFELIGKNTLIINR